MIYDKNYFFTECEGYKTFLSSKGLKLSRRLLKIYNKVIELKPKRVLDFGCGRGELALNLALNWIETFGADSSKEAIEISNQIKNYWKKTNPDMKLEFIKTDGYVLPFQNDFFDSVILSDVIEHINPKECDLIMKEIYRVLRKGGYVLLHTSPNRIFINFGLKIYWLIGLFNGIKLPFKMKRLLPKGLGNDYHINEQTSFSLKKLFKKNGYKNINTEFWKNPHYVYYFLKEDKYIKIINKVYKFIPVKHLFFADIFASAQK